MPFPAIVWNIEIPKNKIIMSVFEAFGDIAGTLAQAAPERIIALTASPAMSARVEELVNRKKDGPISLEESAELERFLALDLFINLAKARARLALQA
jgi:hypothetical protein